MLDLPHAKTEAGRAEIKARVKGLSRTARNLLLVLDASRSARIWLSAVQGAAEDDYRHLLELGLIAPATPVDIPVALPRAERVEGPLHEAYGTPPQLSFTELSALLSAQAPKQLGLVKGYVMVLDVEKCRDLGELQQLGLTFIERVAQKQGEDAARQMRLLMGVRL